jgi:DNA-directed RNA polymerase subunit RPC12/RpoP
MQKLCPKCGSEMSYKEGISKKNNKPYSMYKCIGCENIVWNRKEAPQSSGHEEVMDALRKIYVKLEEILNKHD